MQFNRWRWLAIIRKFVWSRHLPRRFRVWNDVSRGSRRLFITRAENRREEATASHWTLVSRDADDVSAGRRASRSYQFLSRLPMSGRRFVVLYCGGRGRGNDDFLALCQGCSETNLRLGFLRRIERGCWLFWTEPLLSSGGVCFVVWSCWSRVRFRALR
jgi:hypothetical protein